jgi:hypothetical protein
MAGLMRPSPIFVTRQSPDWAQLAADFSQGRTIDPARFAPPPSVPGFPRNLPRLIAAWNAQMSVDFFTCRARLRALCDESIASIPNARRYACADVARMAPAADDIVFFHDDDDWFAPDLAEALPLPGGPAYDVCVFPLIRLWSETVTFVRQGEGATAIVGARHGFSYRYHSNNYGLSGRICDPPTLAAMQDHMLASDHAERRKLRDVYVDRIVGVTAKTPCSASMLKSVFGWPRRAKHEVRRYVDALGRLRFPPDLEWAAARTKHVAQLFEAAI